MTTSSRVERLKGRWNGLSDHQQVGASLLGVGGIFLFWLVFWPVPTQVKGQGVLIYPNNAGVLNARATGQVLDVNVSVGDKVRKGQVLMTLYLPVLERQLEQQKGNLAQLVRQNNELNQRDALRINTAQIALDTTLAKLADDQARLAQLQATYGSKVENLNWLAKRAVVAPLSSEVVTAEQGLTSTSVQLDDIKIQRKEAVTNFQQIKLNVETEQLNRNYQIDDLKRQIKVTEAQIAYDGTITAERSGIVLDLQVIPGQTIKAKDRLGTIGRAEAPPAGEKKAGGDLIAVAYFPPADARRLPLGLPVEVVPLWNQRGRFGGIEGTVRSVLTLPATPEDISTTVGNTQLADALVKEGPVMRAEISLDRDPRSDDGYRWTLSGGSGVFPIRDGLTVDTFAYVEWRSPITYILPGLRSLTGGYRSLRIDRLWNLPFLRQPGTPR
ncbi:NHPM bacteriocin system secretion protein/ HlyD family [Synechococcus sp. RS9909]|uniref:NHLP bacteriocin system secretion protein n=1 Tax=unclassified Synechococcus TaxID=2626047 RepID=UPI0000690E24|nr:MULTISPECIES: NHLP bacteriocin system secretion protein [unclassified Synechococcus]EAQ68877.1 Secretion protein HlyD [Synechococcus sp. RS9917]QNI78983.1 NHPM bacteriocin system secretion protein/ HlyD family [Synechococcus sp. RS9909]